MTSIAKNYTVYGDGLLARIFKAEAGFEVEEKKSPNSARDAREHSPRLQNPPRTKRPLSANPKIRGPSSKVPSGKRNSRSPVAKFRATDAFLADLASLDREELINTVLSLKKEQNVSENTISMLRADNQRMENEISKQQRRIDKLMAPITSKNGPAIVEMRKEIEKSVLVRQMKVQIQTLRAEISNKDTQLEILKRSQKTSHMLELQAEKDEYLTEVQRLRVVIQEANARLLREKKQREWDRSMSRNNEADLKKEVGMLMTGYKDLLERLALNPSGQERVILGMDAVAEVTDKLNKFSRNMARSSTAAAGSGAPTTTAGGKQSSPRDVTTRPESAPARRPSNTSPPVKERTTRHAKHSSSAHASSRPLCSVGDRGEGLYKGRQKWYPCIIIAVNVDGTYAVDYDDGDREKSVPAKNFRLLPKDVVAKEKGPQKSDPPATAAAAAAAAAAATASGTSTATTTTNVAVAVQAEVRPQPMPVDSAAASGAGAGAVKGAEETVAAVEKEKDRHVLTEHFQKLIQIALRKGGLTLEDVFRHFDRNKDGSVTVGELVTMVKKMKHFQAMAAADLQDIFESMDIDHSGDISWEEFRVLVEGESSAYAEALRRKANAKFKVGDVGDGLSLGDGKWYACRVAAVNEDGSYRLQYDFGEEEDNVPEDRFMLSEEPTPGVTTKRQPKYKVGDEGEANYQGENSWYECTVAAVNDDGTYFVQYDDGEEENGVFEEYIRPVQPTVSTTTKDASEGSVLYNIGDVGEGDLGGDGVWRKCVIGQVNEDGTYRLEYNHGVTEDVTSDMFRLVSAEADADADAKKGKTSTTPKPKMSPRMEAVLDAGLDDYFANLSLSQDDDADADGGIAGYGFLAGAGGKDEDGNDGGSEGNEAAGEKETANDDDNEDEEEAYADDDFDN